MARVSAAAGGRPSEGRRAAAPVHHALLSASPAEAVASSRFPLVRSELFYVLSWVNPLLSGAAAAAVLALFLAHTVLGYSLPLVVAHACFVSLVVGGAATIHNSIQTGAALPLPCIPFDRTAISQLAALTAEAIVSLLERGNALLSWVDAPASARALAYAWLAGRFAFLTSPHYLVIISLAEFGLAPAYLHFQPAVDEAYARQALPALEQASAMVAQVEGRVASLMTSNKMAPVGVAGAALVVLYFLWGVVSLGSLLTLAALCVPLRDATLAFRSSALSDASDAGAVAEQADKLD